MVSGPPRENPPNPDEGEEASAGDPGAEGEAASAPDGAGHGGGDVEAEDEVCFREGAGPRRQFFEFVNDEAPVRLDHFLSARLPGFSRAFLQRLIHEGLVIVDPLRRDVKAAVRVPRGALVKVEVPPPRKCDLAPVDIPLNILYEDPYLAVVDKPPDLAVHPSPSQTRHTLVNALAYHLRDLSSIGGEERPGIVHRLDKETSGVLVVAKCDLAHKSLAIQFKERTIHKTYLAIVRGEPKEWEGRVDLPLGRSYQHTLKQMVRHDGTGREAGTEFRVLEKFRGYALLEVYPRTGRTHQIRVHLLHLRLPIACDKLYGREARVYLSDVQGKARRAGEAPILERQALHAASISFQHPLTREEMAFSAPLHPDMLAFLRALQTYRGPERDPHEKEDQAP